MNTIQPSNHKSKHLPELDGLRGLAILLVVSFHYFNPMITLFSFGWSGVDLFFVLSGFLITGKLADSVQAKDYFGRFYRNRVLRIFPLYYLTLILFFFAISFFVKDEHLKNVAFYKEHWLSFFVFTQNWSLIFYGPPIDTYITHFWSLAVEEQFYIFWPFVIYFFRDRKKLSKILLLIIPIIIIVRSGIYMKYPEYIKHTRYYINTFCRMDSFIIGALICFIYRSEVRISNKMINILFYSFLLFLGLGILMSKNAFFTNPFFPTIGYTVVAVFYGCFLYKIIQSRDFLSSIFRLRFLRFCGKISYGIYIIHWPVRLIVGAKLYQWGISHLSLNAGLINFIVLFICLLLTFIISLISFNYFESYFLRLKR